MDDDPEATPALSGATLEALKEFYTDRDAREKQFEDLRSAAEDEAADKPLNMDAFEENWNESQFWYSQETATTLATQLLAETDGSTNIAVISAPSAFVQLKNLLASRGVSESERPRIYLFEFDKRFGVFPEFVFYDLQNPFRLPPELKGTMDRIICDPPFLSEDCQTKAAMTVRWLSRPITKSVSDHKSVEDRKALRLIVCTGERMEQLVTKLYRSQGLSTTTFEPSHAKGLSNEFYCYANFECEKWTWKP